MADQTTSSILIDASAAEIMAVIGNFAAYPEWAQGIRRAVVLEIDAGGQPLRVFFELDAGPIKDEYTLEYDWHGARGVRWGLVEGKVLRTMDGAYELRERAHGATEVTYRLAVEIGVPMIGMLKRKAEKVVIDTALKGLKDRVEDLSNPSPSLG